MKLSLNVKIDIEIVEAGKVKDSISVYFREYNQSEIKKNRNLRKDFATLAKKLQKVSKKQMILEKKSNLFELAGQHLQALECIEKMEKLDKEVDTLSQKLKTLGGEDQNSFAEKLAKDRFNTLVSGKGKEELVKIAESKGYAKILSELDKAKEELEKKQLGE